jgi:hypothetical protein
MSATIKSSRRILQTIINLGQSLPNFSWHGRQRVAVWINARRKINPLIKGEIVTFASQLQLAAMLVSRSHNNE